MSFPCDGTNHHNAISNEHSTKEYLQTNAHKIYPNVKNGKYTVKSLGGTKNKADNIIECLDGNIIYISDKQKKQGISTGSFDYTNTSKPITRLLDINSNCISSIKNVLIDIKEDKKLPIGDRKKLVSSYRLRVMDASYSFITNLSGNDIIELINQNLIEPNKSMEMFITDGKTNQKYTFPFINHPVINLIETGFIPSVVIKVGKSSGKIIFTDGVVKIDIGLRIRVHTNNGVTALLNAGGTNKSSQFVLKFQQDGIRKLLNNMGVMPIEF